MIRFVTGTDTGVGKTVTSAWLAARAVQEGKTVAYCKPVQTGVALGVPKGDADFVRSSAGVPAYELLRYEEPLAPAVAAGRAGSPIDLDDLVQATRALTDGVDQLIVEGTGGLLVPMTEDRDMADFALALDANLVVAIRPGLGTLNHTLLTLEAAFRRGLDVTALVISGWPAHPGVVEKTNREFLSRFGIQIELIPMLEAWSGRF